MSGNGTWNTAMLRNANAAKVTIAGLISARREMRTSAARTMAITAGLRP